MNERRRKKLKKFCKLWWNSNTTPTAQETTLARPAPAESSATTSAHHTLATWVLETSKFIWSYVSPPHPYYPRFNHFSSFFCLRLENPFLFCLLVEKLKTTSSFVSLWSLQFVTCFPFSGRRGLWEKGGRYASMIFSLSSSWRAMRTFFLNSTPTPICGF